jgi:tetratricopeptide (TPR) repeat protein
MLEISQAKEVLPQTTCNNATLCDELGNKAFLNGNSSTAIKYFKLQVGYAEDAQDNHESAIAYNNLTIAYIHENKYLYALAWTRLALQANPKSITAKRNLAQIEKHITDYHWHTKIGGTYVQYAGRTYWNTFYVSKVTNKYMFFHLIIYRLGPAWRNYGPSQYGDLTGKAIITKDGNAQYSGSLDFPNCRIAMKFTIDAVTFSQHGDCGFGYGVSAFGSYERVNSRRGSE